MSDHLTPEEFFEFIDQGGGSGPAGRHLMVCSECLFELWSRPVGNSEKQHLGTPRMLSPFARCTVGARPKVLSGQYLYPEMKNCLVTRG